MKACLKQNKKGFTLVEAMAAIVIIGILSSGILGTVVFARIQLSDASEKTAAITQAQGVMDVLISSLSTGETNTKTTLEPRTGAIFVSGGAFYFNASAPNQFTFTSSIDVNGNTQYAVTAVSFYAKGEQRVTLTGSAVNTGSTFSVG